MKIDDRLGSHRQEIQISEGSKMEVDESFSDLVVPFNVN